MTKGKAYRAFMKRVSESIDEMRNHDRVEAICINPQTMADLVDESVFAFMGNTPPLTAFRRKPIRYMSEIPQGEFVIASRPPNPWWDVGWVCGPAIPKGFFIYPSHGGSSTVSAGSFTNSKSWTITYDTAGVFKLDET